MNDLPTALDLARLVVALDDRMTWPANAWKHADALRAAAHAVLTATGHADEIPEDPYGVDAEDLDRNAYRGPHLADMDEDASFQVITPHWPAEAVRAA